LTSSGDTTLIDASIYLLTIKNNNCIIIKTKQRSLSLSLHLFTC